MNIGSMDDFKKAGNQLEYFLTPLTKIHLQATAFLNLKRMETYNTFIFSGPLRYLFY